MISFKECIKSVGVIIVTFCAAFLIFLFQGFRIDLNNLDITSFTDIQKSLYDAQITQSNIMLAISGGILTTFAFITLIFSIIRYINKNEENMGILKAMGYSKTRIAIEFCKYGINTFIGTSIGFIASYFFNPVFYEEMNGDHIYPDISISLHPVLLLFVIFIPTLVFSFVSFVIAYIKLNKAPLEMIKKQIHYKKKNKIKNRRENSNFLITLRKTILHSHVSLILFVGFAALCFGASVQMSFSMEQFGTSPLFFWLMFGIGLLLGVSILYLAFGFTYNGNKEYLTILKAYGYNDKECIKCLYGGYLSVTVIGFIIGTVYQYIIFKIIIKVFADYEELSFNYSWSGLIYTILIMSVVYFLINYYYFIKLKKTKLAEISKIN